MIPEPLMILETPVRIQLRVGDNSSARIQAAELMSQFIERKASRFQLQLERSESNGVVTRQVDSVGLRVITKVGSAGFYSLTTEYLQATSLSGRRETTAFLSSSGQLDVQIDVLRNREAAYPKINVPEFIVSCADEESVGLFELVNARPVSAAPISIAYDDAFLPPLLTDQTGTMAVIVIGSRAPISRAQLAKLAKQTCGLAHVVVRDVESATIRAADRIVSGWDVPVEAIRVFSPSICVSDDPLRQSRLFCCAPSAENDEEGATALLPQAVLNEIIWTAGRFTAAALASRVMPTIEAVTRNQSLIVSPADIEGAISVTTGEPDQRLEYAFEETGELIKRVIEQQELIAELRETLTIFADEKAFEEQVAQAWKATAEHQRHELDSLRAASEITEVFSKMSASWRQALDALLLEAVEASEQVRTITNLRETLAVLTAQYRTLENRGAQASRGGAISPPVANDASSLAIYLAEKYPGRFALLGQGARNFKATTTYTDPERFLLALDILGVEYYNWKTAAAVNISLAKNAFDERCREESFKTSPSATAQGAGAYPDEHTVRLVDGSKAAMFELRDNGTTMEERYMLYIGFVWDSNTGQIVLGRFNHPPVLSMHT